MELRNEAIAALLVRDARVIRHIDGTIGLPPAVSADGHRAAFSWVQANTSKRAAEMKSEMKAGTFPMPQNIGGKVVDLETGKDVFRWVSGARIPLAFALSSDGRQVANSCMGDLKVRLRESANLTKEFDWPKNEHDETPQPGKIAQLAFSPNGQYLAGVRSFQSGSEFIVWNLENGQSSILGQEKKGSVGLVTFHPDSTLLAYPSGERSFILWSLEENAKSADIEFPLPVVGQVVFHPQGRLLAVPCLDDKGGTILVWDVERNTERTRLPGDVGLPGRTWGAFDPTTNHLVLYDAEAISVWDYLEGKEAFRVDGAYKQAPLLQFWPTGDRLISYEIDGPLKVWELSDTPPLSSTRVPEGFIFSPDGRWLVGFSEGSAPGELFRKVRRIDRTTGHEKNELTLSMPLHELFFSEDSRQLVAFDAAGNAIVWDVETGNELASIKADNTQPVTSVAFGPDGQLMFAGLPLPDLRSSVWEPGTGREVWHGPLGVQAYINEIASLVASFDFKLNGDGNISVWKLPTGEKSAEIRLVKGINPIASLFSTDNRYLAIHYSRTGEDGITTKDHGFALWNLLTREKVISTSTSQFADFAFTADSRVLAIATHGWVQLWNVKNGEEIFRWQTHSQVLSQKIVFAPGGASLLIDDGRTLHLDKLHRDLAKIGLEWEPKTWIRGR